MRSESILVVAAHPDDAELGVGASASKWVEAGKVVTFLIITAGTSGPGEVSRRVSEQQHAAAVLGVDLRWGDLPDGSVAQHERDAILVIERLIKELDIDTVLVHDPNDTHQDHRAVSNAAIGATRRLGRVLFYESPSTVNFAPDIFNTVEDHHLHTKAKALNCHSSQVENSAMVDEDAMFAQARYRGFQSRSSKYAEGFKAVRLTLSH